MLLTWARWRSQSKASECPPVAPSVVGLPGSRCCQKMDASGVLKCGSSHTSILSLRHSGCQGWRSVL